MLIYNDDNVVYVDKQVRLIIRHLIKASQGWEHDAILQRELNWAQHFLDELLNKVCDKYTPIGYSYEEHDRLLADYEHSWEQIYE